MKKKIFTLLTLLFFSAIINKIQAQDFISKLASEEASTSYLRGTVVNIDGKSFDYRILKHYSEQELKNLPAVKRNQIYFIYTESYRVLNADACKSFKAIDIDVAKIQIFRKEDTNVIVPYDAGCQLKVELISNTELQQKLQEFNDK